MICIFASGRGAEVEKVRMLGAARGSVRRACMADFGRVYIVTDLEESEGW